MPEPMAHQQRVLARPCPGRLPEGGAIAGSPKGTLEIPDSLARVGRHGLGSRRHVTLQR